ncbi:putative HSP20-like chaperone [Seiridium cardinale]
MAYFYMEPPPVYSTTSVSQTFPEAHWPLEHTRHKIGEAVHSAIHPYEQEVRTPHADIRETAKKYYIDIELPGLADKKDLSLKWTGSRTLLVEAKIRRPEIKEEGLVQPEAQPSGTGAKGPEEHPIHHLARERRLGPFARAFHFTMDVDHDQLEANLRHGLLRLVLPKPESEHKQPKEVDVKHEDDQVSY